MSRLYEINEDYFDISLELNDYICIELSLGDFSGKYKYLYDKINLQRLLKEIEKFKEDSLQSSYELYDTDSDSYILFSKKSMVI